MLQEVTVKTWSYKKNCHDDYNGVGDRVINITIAEE